MPELDTAEGKVISRGASIRPGVTVAVTTRNRQRRLLECIQSLSSIGGLAEEVVVFDDASTPPLDVPLIESECARAGLACRVVRSEENQGLIAARNRLAKEARTEYVLTVDDDVIVLNRNGLEHALRILDSDDAVSVVAFPQVNRVGGLDPGASQPCGAEYPCYVDRFYGYSHLMRRAHFLEIGGYREILFYYGEEPDLSLRLYAAGRQVVFVPDRSFAHLPEQTGRDYAGILRFSARNSCICSILNMPLPLAMVATWRYLQWHKNTLRSNHISDDEGRKWVRRELTARFPELWSQRRPASWRTIMRWKSIQKHTPRYHEREITPAP